MPSTVSHQATSAQRSLRTPAEISAEVFSYLIVLGGLGTIAAAIYFTVHSYHRVFFWDMWSAMDFLLRRPRPLIHWIGEQHNEHRIVVPKLLLLVDFFVFKARSIFLLSATLSVFAITWGILIWAFSVLGDFRGAKLRTFAGTAALCLFSISQWENFASGFHIAVVLPDLFVTLSLLCMILYEPARKTGRTGAVQLSTALVSGVLATFSLANGMLLWPVAVLLCLFVRVRAWVIALVSVVGGLSILAYMWGYRQPPSRPSPWSIVQEPVRVLSYICGYVGAPWVWNSFKLAVVFGAAGILLAVVILAVVVFRGNRNPIAVLTVALMIFSLATAAITALGRMQLGYNQALSPRYETFALLFWMSAGGYLLLVVGKRPRQLIAIQAIVLVLMAIGAWRLKVPLRHGYERQLTVNTASLAMVTGVFDPPLYRYLFPNPQLVWADTPILKAKKLSIFSTNLANDLNTPIESAYRLDGGLCKGSADKITPLATGDATGVKVVGWAWDPMRRKPPTRIIFAGESRIVGYAEVGYPRLELPAHLGSGHALMAGWVGYIEPVPLPFRVTTYAVVNSRRKEVCQVANAAFTLEAQRAATDAGANPQPVRTR